MLVTQMKYIPEAVFLSLSDETKLRMVTNQIYVSITDKDVDTWHDIFHWLCENVDGPFHMLDEKDKNNIKTKSWIYFYEETDMMAFKLRWV